MFSLDQFTCLLLYLKRFADQRTSRKNCDPPCFQSFARNNARERLWEIIPYLECDDCKDSWERDRNRMSFAFPYRRNSWRNFCSRKPVFSKLLEGDFHFDIRTRCQKEDWMSTGTLPIQSAPRKGFEKSWGREATFCRGWNRLAAVESAEKWKFLLE